MKNFGKFGRIKDKKGGRTDANISPGLLILIKAYFLYSLRNQKVLKSPLRPRPPNPAGLTK